MKKLRNNNGVMLNKESIGVNFKNHDTIDTDFRIKIVLMTFI